MSKDSAIDKPKTLPEYLGPIWDETVSQVREKIGAAGLEALCLQIHRMRDAQGRIAKDGAIVLDGKGNAGPHPAVAIEKAAQAEIRSWLKDFGGGRSR